MCDSNELLYKLRESTLLNMIKTGPLLFFITTTLLSINPCVAATASVTDEQKNIKVLLTKLGIATLVGDIPTTMKNGVLQKQQEKGIEKSQYDKKVSMVVNDYFASEKILDDIAARLMKTKLSPQYQNARYDSIQKLLNSTSAAKLVALKQKSRSSAAVNEIKKLAAQHEDNPLAKERLQLFESFDNAAAETEFSIAVQALSIDAILKINNAADSVESKKQQNVAKQDVLSSTYELLLRPSRYTTMMTLQYMFDASSDEEIDRKSVV